MVRIITSPISSETASQITTRIQNTFNNISVGDSIVFEPGIYKINDSLTIGLSSDISNFSVVSIYPNAAELMQTSNNKSILKFNRDNTHTWTVDGIRFSWETGQSKDDIKSTAILFTKPAVITANNGYYSGRISNCSFANGFRGISIEGTGQIPLFNTSFYNLQFKSFTGSAIRLSSPSPIGMPENSFRDIFIYNYDSLRANTEHQIFISGQTGVTFDNIGLEGSSTKIFYADTSVATLNNFHIENLKVVDPYTRLFYFAGGSYSLNGFDISGNVNSNGFGHIIFGETANVITNKTYINISTIIEKLQVVGGGGPLAFIGGSSARYRILGRIDIKSKIYDDALSPDISSAVTLDNRITQSGVLTFSTIQPNRSTSKNVSVPNANVGDSVSLGAPFNFQDGLIAFAYVNSKGSVQIRILNSNTFAVTPSPSSWTIETGGGPVL